MLVPAVAVVALDRHGGRMLRVFRRTARQGSDTAESLVRGDEHRDLPSRFQIESHRQLEGIQGSKTLTRPVPHQQMPGRLKVVGLKRLAKPKAPLAQVSSQASPGDFGLRFADFAGAQFDGEDGLHLDDGEMGNKKARAWHGHDPSHEFGAQFAVIQLRPGTRVEEIVWQLALLPQGDYGVGE
jgi:hypothetical protein